jgi:hypothetical protein
MTSKKANIAKSFVKNQRTKSNSRSKVSALVDEFETLREQIAAFREQLANSTFSISSSSTNPESEFPAAAKSSIIDPWPSKKSLPIYEVREVRTVNDQAKDFFDGSNSNSDEGFYGGLLESTRLQWQFGDWQSLSALEPATIQHHQERAKIALLAAAGCFQTNHFAEGKYMLHLAKNWGIENKWIFRILAAGVHNTLFSASEIMGNQARARGHLEAALLLGAPSSDTRLLLAARLDHSAQTRPTSISFSKSISEEKLRENFYIKPGYQSRKEYVHFDDLGQEDGWQLEVYLRAYGMMKKNQWTCVADVGCGSAYKLLTYLGDFETIGYELPVNVEELKSRYPDRRWEISDFDGGHAISADLIICSDVIEHLVNPDTLLSYLQKQEFKILILSTPERDLVLGANSMGPPENSSHQREWNSNELIRYISDYFTIQEHAVVNQIQGTQIVICSKK